MTHIEPLLPMPNALKLKKKIVVNESSRARDDFAKL